MDLDDYTDLEADFLDKSYQSVIAKLQKKKNSLGVHLRIILVSPSLYPVLSEFIMSKKN